MFVEALLVLGMMMGGVFMGASALMPQSNVPIAVGFVILIVCACALITRCIQSCIPSNTTSSVGDIPPPQAASAVLVDDDVEDRSEDECPICLSSRARCRVRCAAVHGDVPCGFAVCA